MALHRYVYYAAGVFIFTQWLRERKAVLQRGAKPISRVDRSLLRKKFHKKHIEGKEFNTIIIGSGMGSLSCAAMLARMGKKVLVLEQHPDVAGGGTHQFDLGGYRFDSGLHYTVPWSVPVFALTCLLRPQDVTPFDLMGEADGTVDNIFLDKSSAGGDTTHFKMLMHEKHLPKLYAMFPNEKEAIDIYMDISNKAMLFVKLYIASRLMPKWMQRIYWSFVPPAIIHVASLTAEEVLPTLTSNKKLIGLLSSMWIDTGARPDQASFTMTASVFRGISMEGGCYPSRGSEEMAIELARVINDNGGSIVINAPVEQILVNREPSLENRNESVHTAVGVRMGDKDNTCVYAPRVVSGAGFSRTFKNLLDVEVTKTLDLPTELSVPQSAGFVMVNIGLKATAEEIGASTSNTWHIPADKSDDIFEPMRAYFAKPLEVGMDMPAFITFPSCKDKKWEAEHPGRTSCQMLFMAEYDWFEEYTGDKRKIGKDGACDDHQTKYKELKETWQAKALEVFFKYFPKGKDHVEFVDISTPLSAEDYLNASRGSAVGIDVTPARFVDGKIRDALDCVVTDIQGLYMTGQDTLLCGVTLAQLAGVITAFRMEGFWVSCGMVLRAVLFT